MQRSAAPTDPREQLQWLVDRAEIADLLVTFVRSLDEEDYAGYAALFTQDGVLIAPGDARVSGHDAIAAGIARTFATYPAVWHINVNPAITVHGDRASARSYFIAVHVNSDDQFDHATTGGWYDSKLVRTPDGWRLTEMDFAFRWRLGNGALPAERI